MISVTRDAAPSDQDGTLPTESAPLAGAAPPPPAERAPSPSRAGKPRGTSQQVRDPERYAILGEHGRGGLGRVSRAHDRDLGRDVAIKELISRDYLSERRFVREALVTAKLEHPGIVPVHEAGRWPDGTPFYAMKLVSGRPLRELIAERKTVDERIALLHHVIAVADAMAYAHGRGIIHRDLKPANVIVGDFGETVFIDWGLAKDLTTRDPEDPADGSPEVSVVTDDQLTATGSVLGTPAYMAPEQERGEHVDQRADVFAIGAMLWELCSLQRVPPTDTALRHRMLRRAGIDQDLVAILDKALASELGRRYAHAGALAADLKAFKSGARISARRYSALAVFGRWIRRHRGLAAVLAAVVVAAALGGAMYVRNIAVERDRADVALGRANAANDQMILDRAALLLRSDPTESAAALVAYHGSDVVQRDRLLAEAQGRGVATASFKPHSKTIWFLAGEKDGGILSVAEDHQVRLTLRGVSTTLASDVAKEVQASYAPATRLLAYAAAPPGIVLLDLNAGTSRRLDTNSPISVAFAPDGSRLAAVDRNHVVTVWAVTPVIKQLYRQPIADAYWVSFMTTAQIAVIGLAVQTIAVDQMNGGSARIAVPKITALDTRPDAVVTGDFDGNIVLVTTTPGSPGVVLSGRGSVCAKRIDAVKFVPRTDLIAFACEADQAGVVRYDASQRSIVIVDSFALQTAFMAEADFLGRFVVFAGQPPAAYIYDVATHLISRYDGHAARLATITAPTADFGSILVGDMNGAVRSWDPPEHRAVALRGLASYPTSIAFIDDKTFLTSSAAWVAQQVDLNTNAVATYGGHRNIVSSVVPAPDGDSFLSFGFDGDVRVWRRDREESVRVFSNHGSPIAAARYIEGGRRIASIGDDGRLFAWSPEGADVALLMTRPVPLVGLEVLARTGHLVVEDQTGSIWEVVLDGATKQIRPGDGTAARVSAFPDGSRLAIGDDDGRVTVYDTATWTVVMRATIPGRVSLLRFDPKGREVLVVSEDQRVWRLTLETGRAAGWRDVPVAARDLAYSPDGETIAIVCIDGGEWFYSMRTGAWVYTHDHEASPNSGAFSPDGSRFVSVDARGVAVVHDIASMFAKNDKQGI